MIKGKRNKFKFFLVFFIAILGVSTMFRFSYANNYKSKSDCKVAYITIDDGPSKYTEEILDVLNKYNAKATFFMIDKNMRTYPNAVKMIIERGNTPGFHSVSHDINRLYKTNKSAKEEFDINKKTLLELTGIESNIVRLPYGSKPYTPYKSYENIVEAGYKMWDWDIDTEDWKSSSEKVVQNVKMYSKGKDNIVILMHERKQTAKSLERILKYLTSEGYVFVPIDEYETPQNYWLKNLK